MMKSSSVKRIKKNNLLLGESLLFVLNNIFLLEYKKNMKMELILCHERGKFSGNFKFKFDIGKLYIALAMIRVEMKLWL